MSVKISSQKPLFDVTISLYHGKKALEAESSLEEALSSGLSEILDDAVNGHVATHECYRENAPDFMKQTPEVSVSKPGISFFDSKGQAQGTAPTAYQQIQL